MKTLLCLASVLLILAAPLHAQEPIVQDLPELQEWYSWSGAKGAHISYLPNFDTANGGINAVTQKRDNNSTWFNRFAYDTTNQFTWASTWVVTRADLNGDGITDYIDAAGNVYQGVKKNSPPERVLGVSYGGLQGGGFVGDFNNDGYQDIIVPTREAQTFMIQFGGSDLLHLQRTTVSMPPFAFSSWTGIAAYVTESKQGRFISYRKDSFTEGYYLYGLIFEGTPSDSIIVSLNELSFVQEKLNDKKEQIFVPSETMFYYDYERNNYFFNFIEGTPTINSGKLRTRAYEIKSDAFILIKYNAPGAIAYGALNGSIDGDSIPDVVLPKTGTQNGEKKRYFYVYSGNPIYNELPRTFFQYYKCDGDIDIKYIGDVTGDGIGDVAYGCSSNGDFRIFKGVDWRLVNVKESAIPKLTVYQTEPNPVNNSGLLVLPMSIERRGHYTVTLYNLAGKLLGELFSGELPSGENRLPLNVSSYNLPSGMYTLRLSDGKQIRERAFSLIR